MPMIDMSDQGIDESQEPHSVKPGDEHKLVIVSVNSGTDKNDFDYIMPKLEIIGDPYAKDFSHFLHIPDKDKMDAKTLNKAKWNFSVFAKCFGIDLSRPTDPSDDWPGAEGYAILGVGDNEEYGEQNFVKKFVTPK